MAAIIEYQSSAVCLHGSRTGEKYATIIRKPTRLAIVGVLAGAGGLASRPARAGATQVFDPLRGLVESLHGRRSGRRRILDGDMDGGILPCGQIAGATLDLVPGMGHDLPLALMPRLASGITANAARATPPGSSGAG